MHAVAVLQKLLRRSIPSIHLKRLDSLVALVGSALCGGRLTLSALGRSLPGHSAVRHRIKRADRLLGNVHLHEERLQFYRVLCDLLIGARAEPVLIVDWSDLRPDRSWLLLRASVWVHGFALPIYEEVHPLRLQNNRRVQREFLLTLRMLLGEGVRPIVVADAGFRSTWFDELDRLQWRWVGRIRGRTMVQLQGTWLHCRTLFARATARPQDLGQHCFTQARPVMGRLVLYRKPAQGRHDFNRYGRPARSRASLKNACREREPWLIAASPSLSDKTALDLINLYRVRMRIEHSFRTLKSHQFGFAFEDSQSRKPERMAVLLLIHALVMLLAWIAGWAAQRVGLQLRLRSNITEPASLSIITLGWMALTMLRLRLSAGDFIAAFNGKLGPPTPLSDVRI
jgi:hypothetical protein